MLRTSVASKGNSAAQRGSASEAAPLVEGADAVENVEAPVTPRTSESQDNELEEAAWLNVYLSEGELIFSQDEINETTEEIIELCSDVESLSIGSDADAVIDAQNSQQLSQNPLVDILRASERLVSHESVQSAVINAVRDDPDLRERLARLSESNLISTEGTVPSLLPPETPRNRERTKKSSSVWSKIVAWLSKVWGKIKNACSVVGRIIKDAVCWLWQEIKDAMEFYASIGPEIGKASVFLNPAMRYFGTFGRSAQISAAVLAFGMLLIIAMIMKRVSGVKERSGIIV